MILRTVDSLGFKDIDPWQGTYEMRSDYAAGLKQLIRAVKAGENPEKIPFDNLSLIYQNAEEPDQGIFLTPLAEGGAKP